MSDIITALRDSLAKRDSIEGLIMFDAMSALADGRGNNTAHDCAVQTKQTNEFAGTWVTFVNPLDGKLCARRVR